MSRKEVCDGEYRDLVSLWLFDYDEMNRLRARFYDADADGESDQGTYYEFDDVGHVVAEMSDSDMDGRIEVRRVYTWEDDLLMRIDRFLGDDSKPIGTTRYTYDDLGLEILQEDLDALGNVRRRWESRYNGRRQLVEYRLLYRGELEYTVHYEYDVHGRLIREWQDGVFESYDTRWSFSCPGRGEVAYLPAVCHASGLMQ